MIIENEHQNLAVRNAHVDIIALSIDIKARKDLPPDAKAAISTGLDILADALRLHVLHWEKNKKEL